MSCHKVFFLVYCTLETPCSVWLFQWLVQIVLTLPISAQLKQCCSRRAVVRPFPFPTQPSAVSWPALPVQLQQTCSLPLRQALRLAADTTCTLRSLTICESVLVVFGLIFTLCFHLDNLGISAAECSDFAPCEVNLSCYLET